MTNGNKERVLHCIGLKENGRKGTETGAFVK